jgi:hypothetical protein
MARPGWRGSPVTKPEVFKVALKVWNEVLDDNQKAGIRLGLFPAEVMEKYDTFSGPQLAVALMTVGAANDDMIADKA